MGNILRQSSESVQQSLLAVFCRDERGATLIEYSLLIGLISAAMIVLILWVGDWMAWTWQNLIDALAIVGP